MHRALQSKTDLETEAEIGIQSKESANCKLPQKRGLLARVSGIAFGQAANRSVTINQSMLIGSNFYQLEREALGINLLQIENRELEDLPSIQYALMVTDLSTRL